MLTAGTAISTDDGRRIVRRAGLQRRGVCGFAGLGRFHRFGRAEDGRGGVPEEGLPGIGGTRVRDGRSGRAGGPLSGA